MKRKIDLSSSANIGLNKILSVKFNIHNGAYGQYLHQWYIGYFVDNLISVIRLVIPKIR